MYKLIVVMRIAGPNDQLRGAVRLAALLGAVAVVAGCSSTGLPSFGGSMPSWFSRTSSPGGPGTEAQAAVPAGRVMENDCPSVDIKTGAGTLAVGAKQQQDSSANDLRYQLTFLELARQCFADGGTVRMRVGVQGRAIVGPAGAPAQVNAPIRYAVVQEGVHPKTIVTRFRRVPVTLDPVNGSTFTDIEEDLNFPMPPPNDLAKYVVYVGFDEAGDRQQPQAKKKAPKAQAQPKPQKKLERSVLPEYR
ncbi:MAG: hypothetical protein K2Y71_01915 [Xanthobacteraceae bacterium]|nr:hypothetical protein [Xanthobacteraceae bacterium]